LALLILAGGLTVYTVTWLCIASAGTLEMFSGGTHHYRMPGHTSHGDVIRMIFEPAYRIDRAIRPRYWHWVD
jgi:hypothetical protein